MDIEIQTLLDQPVIIGYPEIDLINLKNQYKDIVIQGVEDKEGYKLANKAKNELVKVRNTITKARLSQTRIVDQYKKKAIEKERELLAIIEPIEIDLKAQIEQIDQELIWIERKKLLPQKVDQLKAIGVEVEEDVLLNMSETQYVTFYMQHLDAHTEKIKRQQEEIEAEKARQEQAKKDLEEKERQAEQAKIDEAKRDKERKEEIKRIKKQAKIDAERKLKEKQEKEEAKKAKALAEAKKNSKVQEFYTKYEKEIADTTRYKIEKQYYTVRSVDGIYEDITEITLYKKVDSIDV